MSVYQRAKTIKKKLSEFRSGKSNGKKSTSRQKQDIHPEMINEQRIVKDSRKLKKNEMDIADDTERILEYARLEPDETPVKKAECIKTDKENECLHFIEELDESDNPPLFADNDEKADEIEMDAIGIDAIGIDTVEMDAIEMEALGIDTITIDADEQFNTGGQFETGEQFDAAEQLNTGELDSGDTTVKTDKKKYIRTLEDGTRLEGIFVNNRLSGPGVMKFPNGKIYTGGFKDGKFSGRGTMTFPSGSVYSGEYRNNRRHGQGKMSFPGGYEYSGQFINNEPEGFGDFIFPDGKTYSGQFKKGKFNGQGTLIYSDQTKYEGQFKNDLRHGQGTMTYSNGFRYVGQFIKNKSCGQGTMIFPDGSRYEGQFRNDKRTGHGSITYYNGLKYTGQFEDGKYNGQGRLIFPDGTRFEGMFKEDRYHGKGEMIYPDGTRISGNFINGTLESEKDENVEKILSYQETAEQKTARRDIDGRDIDGRDTAQATKPKPKKQPSWYPTLKKMESSKPEKTSQAFRNRFMAACRTADGHYVRSNSEMIVDNWLYMMGIVHVYERRLPIKEEIYSHFYLPKGKLYIECCRDKDDEGYIYGKQKKIDIYHKYNFNLIQLQDDEIQNLDDVLPRKLIKFGIHTF